MVKKKYFVIIMIVLVVVTAILIFNFFLNNPRWENYPEITIRHWQYFDASRDMIIREDEKGYSYGDFRWESTGYQLGEIGSIKANFMVTMHSQKHIIVSRLKKIENDDFDSVSRSICSKVEHDQFDKQMLRVNDGDVLCLSLDKNRDGVFGDSYLKLKIISHTDSSEGNYADSMTFIYKVL